MAAVGVAVVVIAIVVVVGAAAVLGPRIRVPVPLLLVVLGVGIAFVPGVPAVELDPDLVLAGVLPPLLYAASIRTSLVDIRENRVSILALAIGLVGFTTVVVGFAVHALAPVVPLVAALALGAIVAPPDAVATTALGRTIGMPRWMTSLLEDESLLNDAAALVALNLAIAGLTRPIGPGEALLQLGTAAGGGVVAGAVVGIGLALVRRRIQDPVLDTMVSFAAPYLAFLPAQAVGASGVLAVVVAGLILAHEAPKVQTARARVTEAVNWRTIAFLLENSVFLLIGLQVPGLLRGVATSGIAVGTVLVTCGVALGAAVLARFIWVFGALGLAQLTRQRRVFRPSGALVVSWAGMRGVVTLAAAFLLPAGTPYRPVLQLAAFVVVAGTLLLQGLTLGRLLRLLGLEGPDPAADALQEATLLATAARAGRRRLDELLTGGEPEPVVRTLRGRADARAEGAWERLGRAEVEPPTAVYRRLRLQMLAEERAVIVRARDSGEADDEVLRRALRRVDEEESMLDGDDDAGLDLGARGTELIPGGRGVQPCEHLKAAPREGSPRTPGQCEDCVTEGSTWVHLRACLTCGHVGCCDSSPGRHASKHSGATTHPIIQSIEPGEAWRWCFVDEIEV
jgi:CPA1 family monovalent cation:H+ antiporter